MPAPTITSLTPPTGPTGGRTLVDVEGSGFRLPPPPPPSGPTPPPRPSVHVLVGAREATDVRVRASDRLSFISPIGDSGPADVIVRNLDDDGVPIPGEGATLAGGFTYQLPPLAAESDLARLVRTLLRELKRQVLPNVSLTVQTDFDAQTGDELHIASGPARWLDRISRRLRQLGPGALNNPRTFAFPIPKTSEPPTAFAIGGSNRVARGRFARWTMRGQRLASPAARLGSMSTTHELLERVSGAQSATESFQTVLSHLRERFDCDIASLHVAAAYPVTNSGPVASLGFDPEILGATARRWPAYLPELEPLGIASVERRGVVSDRDVYTRAEQAKKAYYRELSLAEGGLDAVAGYLQFRRKPIAAVMLARRAGTFAAPERDELADLLPALSLVVAAAPGIPQEWPSGVHLTPRERQVLGYASAGLTNEQIATCLDSSVNTVRNQIASLLSKLELDSRTDLARSGLDAFEPLHRP